MPMREETVLEGGWGLPLMWSSLIAAPFTHAFSTRAGGVSAPPFAALNLGTRWGDDAASVDENRRRLLRSAGAPGPLYVARQVHGVAVTRVRAGDDPDAIARVEADALITGDPGVTLGVFVADCIPAVLVDPRTGAIAAAHAGWRGTVAGVLPAVVRALGDAFGARAADLRVALGPAIGPCCFEVGDEVVAAFEAAHGPLGALLTRPKKAHIDLKGAIARRLVEHSGLRPENVIVAPECTKCSAEKFFSFRREGPGCGHHAVVALLR